MSEITAGPYEIKIGLWGHEGEFSIWGAKNEDGAQPLICIVHQQNEKHDAPLLAASFDLLAALEALKLECLADPLNPCWNNRPTDHIGQHWGSTPDNPVDACSSCNARAVIARARGHI